MNSLKAIYVQALLAVLKPDQEYEIRKILRWYSKTFSTPMREVEEMPLDDVLQAWYEERFEGMDEETLEEIRREIVESDDERAARLKEEDSEQADADEYAKIVAAEEEAKERAAKKKAALEKPPLPKPTERQPLVNPGSMVTKEQELPEMPKEIPPNITMTFMSEEELEEELEGFGTMKQPSKAR